MTPSLPSKRTAVSFIPAAGEGDDPRSGMNIVGWLQRHSEE